MTNMNRRTFLAYTAALAGATPYPTRSDARKPRTRLILLGTGGGPRPRRANAPSAQVIVANGTAYVIDCGNGVARQLAFAGVPFAGLRHVFITHHHSDHDADYGNLIWLAWTAGLKTRVDTWGPPPLRKMTRLFFEMNAYDINTRIADEGRVPLIPLVHVHELNHGRHRHAGREREGDGGTCKPSASRASVRLSIRRRRSIDRNLRRYYSFRQSRGPCSGCRRSRT